MSKFALQQFDSVVSICCFCPYIDLDHAIVHFLFHEGKDFDLLHYVLIDMQIHQLKLTSLCNLDNRFCIFFVFDVVLNMLF